MSPARTLALGLLALGGVAAAGFGIAWGTREEAVAPAADEPAGLPSPRGDRGENGLWMRRVWLHEARTEAEVRALAEALRARGITQLYPFLGPLGPEGRPGWRDGETVRPYDPEIVRNFFAALRRADPGMVALPWTGGVYPRDVPLEDPAFRARFAEAMAEVVRLGAHGVQLNVEPMPTGHPDFLALIDAVRAAIGPDAILSLAAYPPTTPLHPFPDVHWELDYASELCRRVDDMSFMAYDTAQTDRDVYAGLVATWTRELAGALPTPEQGGCTWRIGLPAYEDDFLWHRPDVETLEVAIRGLREGLGEGELPSGFRGVALYASWTLDAAEWATYDQQWRGRAPVQAALPDETPAN